MSLLFSPPLPISLWSFSPAFLHLFPFFSVLSVSVPQAFGFSMTLQHSWGCFEPHSAPATENHWVRFLWKATPVPVKKCWPLQKAHIPPTILLSHSVFPCILLLHDYSCSHNRLKQLWSTSYISALCQNTEIQGAQNDREKDTTNLGFLGNVNRPLWPSERANIGSKLLDERSTQLNWIWRN